MKHPVPPVSPQASDTKHTKSAAPAGHAANVTRAIKHGETHGTMGNHATGEDAGFPHMGEAHPPGESY